MSQGQFPDYEKELAMQTAYEPTQKELDFFEKRVEIHDYLYFAVAVLSESSEYGNGDFQEKVIQEKQNILESSKEWVCGELSDADCLHEAQVNWLEKYMQEMPNKKTPSV